MERVKRRYRAPRREQQAKETRRAIVEAALELFTSQGFTETSLRQVAERALVSEQTIYNAFGDKIGLLSEAAMAYIAAGGGPEEAEFLAALRAEPDPVQRIRMVAQNSRQTWDGPAVDLERTVFNPAIRDRRLDELAQKSLVYRLASTRAVCEILFPDEIRRPGLELDDVAAFATAVDSAAVVTTLRALDWSMDDWEAWVAEFLMLFLDPDRLPAR